MAETRSHSGSPHGREGGLDRLVEAAGRTGIVRPTHERIILGVCRGLAARLDIDPLIVRVALVALTIFAGGLGFALYLVAAALLPDDTGRITLVRALRHGDGRAIGWLALTAAVTVSVVVGAVANHDSGQFLWLAVVALLLRMLWRRSAARGPGLPAAAAHAGPGVATGADPASPPAARAAQDPMPVITPWGATADPAPGPYTPAAGHSAYSAPAPRPVVAAEDPAPPAPGRRALGARLWLVAAGLAIVAYTLTRTALAATGRPALLVQLAPLAVTAIVLGALVLAVGVAGYRTSGLAPVVAGTTALALITSTTGALYGTDATLGQVQWTPGSVADVESRYAVGMGEGTLDLTRIPADQLAGRTVATTVGMGTLVVKAPDDLAVTVEGTVRMGELRLVEPGGDTHTMGGLHHSGTLSAGSGPTLHLVSSVGMGETRIERIPR